MATRAEAMAATRERIVESAADAFSEAWYEDVTIRDVAAAAGVALQTVRNHFPTKDELFVAGAERITERIASVRWNVSPGDVDGALSTLLDDYDRSGDSIIRMLAVEERIPVMQPHLALGRRKHEEWVELAFAPLVVRLRGNARRRRIAQLVAITDVYTWKLLRRDRNFDRSQTIQTMREMILALEIGGGPA
jgi:AcrR family transcriptional regulator